MLAVEQALHVEKHKGYDSVGSSTFVYFLDEEIQHLLYRPVRLPIAVALQQRSLQLGQVDRSSCDHCLESLADCLQ
jgi:hypothetical protein